MLRLIDFDGVDKKVNDITLSKLKIIGKINIDTIISGSMHIKYNYENILNYGFQGIACPNIIFITIKKLKI